MSKDSRQKASMTEEELQSLESSLKLWISVSGAKDERIQELEEQNIALQRENATLRRQIRQQRRQIRQQHQPSRQTTAHR